MTLIRTQKRYRSRQADSRPLLLLCGFGGSVWHMRRLVAILNDDGYDVTVLDYPKSVLSSGDPSLLPSLTDEVVQYAEDMALELQEPIKLVGVSLGALLALNIIRRSSMFRSGVLITGGDIVKIAQKLYPKVWPQSYAQLAGEWELVNMYTPPDALVGKKLLFVVHTKSTMIDVADIRAEFAVQLKAGNSMQLIERTSYDHIGTIIDETIIHPKRVLTYIAQLDAA